MDTYRHDGLTFDVLDSGPRDGEVVLCLHGFPQDATAYDGVSPLLTARGLRVLAPHQRGYSPGARPTDRSAYAMRHLVGDAVALLDAAGVDRVHVIGHDWGGAVAWVLAGRHPDRVRSLTVLSTPHPAAMSAALLRSSQGARSAYFALFQVPVLPEALALASGATLMRRGLRRSGLPAEAVGRYVDRLAEPGALTAALGWYRAVGPWRHRQGSGAGRVRVPTTLVSGTHDPFFAAQPVRSSETFVEAPFRSVELDAGHWLPETEPAAVADAVLSGLRGVRPVR